MGLNSSGIEINPFLARFTELSLDWSAGESRLKRASGEVLADLEERWEKVSGRPLDQAVRLLGVPVPPIHNPLRWWRANVLRDLLAAKAVLYSYRVNDLRYRLLWLTLGTGCIGVANIKRLHPTLTFVDRSAERIDVRGELGARLDRIATDLAYLNTKDRGTTNTIVCGDALRASEYYSFKKPVCVVTSPPYPNRYSYVWETRPHLYMMDLIDNGRAAAKLDLDAPGGTWGIATSVLVRGEIQPVSEALGKMLREQVTRLRRIDNLMANYVVKYFNMMEMHFTEMGKILPRGSRFAYVVGNSRIKGVDIPTEAILAGQLKAQGWARIDGFLVFRRRIGKKALFEAAIIGEKVV